MFHFEISFNSQAVFICVLSRLKFAAGLVAQAAPPVFLIKF